MARKFLAIVTDEVEKALKGMKKGKAAGDDGVTTDILKDGAVVVGKLAKLFSECLRTHPWPAKMPKVFLSQKKGMPQSLKGLLR